MFNLDSIREEDTTSFTIESKDGDIVFEMYTQATKQWNQAVKKYKPDLKSYIDPNSGLFAISGHQSVELKKALGSLVISITQGDTVEKDSDKIIELFTEPALRVFPQKAQAHLNAMGNEQEEGDTEQNEKHSSGSAKKPTKTQTQQD